MDYIILVFTVLIILYTLYKHYEPKIEIIVLIKHYKVYLSYNKWDGSRFKGRAYKYLFKV